MTLTNHLLTGAVIAKVLPLPVAIPVAFLSHFVLDALPHFGFASIEERMQKLKYFRWVIVVDVVLAILLSVWLLKNGHVKWFIVGLVAYSPDLLWIYRFTVEEKFGKVRPTKGNWFIQFHRQIQKYERIWGGIVELIYAAGMFLILK